MEIAIIGAGAVGLFLASAFRKEGQEVTVFTRDIVTADQIEKEGITLSGKRTSKKNVCASSSSRQGYDLIIVAVKSYHVHEVVSQYQVLAREDSAWLFVQNGMDHLKEMEVLSEHVYVGVLEYGLYKKKGSLDVEVRGLGQLKIAAFSKGSKIKKSQISNAGDPELISIDWCDSYKDMLEQKLVVNACINLLTAILQVENGTLIRVPGYREAMKDIFNETMLALGRSDIENRWVHVLNVCQQTAKNHSSMATDVRNGRPLELEAIAGYIIRLGQKKEMATPKLMLLYNLLSKETIG